MLAYEQILDTFWWAQKVVYLGVTVIVAQSLKNVFSLFFFQAKVWPASVGKVH